jgi:hypothetical protein
MARLLERLAPFDEQILAIMNERRPLIDEIEELRHQMTQECIHPVEHLVDNGDHVLCKFCSRKLIAPNVTEE